MPKQWTVTPRRDRRERVADRFQVTREAQDAFALRSHQRALAAQKDGAFDAELIPVRDHGRCGRADEGPRADTSEAALAALKPVFRREGGTVTAGNSSPLNDGAAALLLAGPQAVEKHDLPALGRILGGRAAGVDPDIMGIGPLPATQQLLARGSGWVWTTWPPSS